MSSKLRLLQDIQEELEGCTRCKLHSGRTNIVFGEGSPDAEVAFVGEGPGYNEDQQGRPFIGLAGQLLDRMITAMGFSRQSVFITNVVKCRPPDNRVPERDEVDACSRYMLRELQIVRPRAIVLLGLSAAKAVFNDPRMKLIDVRGTWRQLPTQPALNIPTLITYHPAAVLRNSTLRQPVWEDLQKVMRFLRTGETE
jgi:DNA polymerase